MWKVYVVSLKMNSRYTSLTANTILFYIKCTWKITAKNKIRVYSVLKLPAFSPSPFIDRINIYFNLKSLAAYMLTSGSWEVLLNDFSFTFRILCSPVICLSHWYNYTHTHTHTGTFISQCRSIKKRILI